MLASQHAASTGPMRLGDSALAGLEQKVKVRTRTRRSRQSVANPMRALPAPKASTSPSTWVTRPIRV